MNPPDDKVTADTRELWERAFDAYCNGTGDATSHERAAAVLAPVVRERDEAQQLLNERARDTEDWATVMSDVHQYFAEEKADRSRGRGTLLLTLLGNLRNERDQLRAEIVRLEKNLYTGDDDEKRDLRAEFEKLTIVAAQTADRNTDLRAEVERLQRLNLDAVRSIDSRGEEIADLRAQLAASTAQRLNDSTTQPLTRKE